MPADPAVSPEFPVDENALRIPYERLKDFMTSVFQAVGLPDADAEGLARAMADGDLLGKDSHGCIRVPMYVGRIKGGAINKTPNIRIEKQTPAMALVNGDNGMGHLVARYAMELAMDMAAKSGPFRQLVVIVRNGGRVRTAEFKTKPAVDHETDRYIANGEVLPRDVGTRALQMRVQLFNLHGEVAPALLDKPGFVPRRFVKLTAEKRPSKRYRRLVIDPIHPLLDPGPHNEVSWVEFRRSIFGGQISDNCVRFPERYPVFHDRRNQANRIDGQELRIIRWPVSPAPIFTFIGQPKFATYPQNLTNINGVRPP